MPDARGIAVELESSIGSKENMVNLQLNPAAIRNQLIRAFEDIIRRAAVGVTAITHLPDGDLSLSESSFDMVFNKPPSSTSETREDFRQWVLTTLVADSVQAFERAVEEIRILMGLAIKSTQTTLKTPITGSGVEVLAALRDDELEKFRKKPWKTRLDDLSARFGLQFPWRDEFDSIVKARNCLQHRSGAVERDDLTDENTKVLCVRYRAMRIQAVSPTGDTKEVAPGSIVEAGWGIQVQQGIEMTKTFRLGEVVRFESQELTDIITTLQAIGYEVVKQVVDRFQQFGIPSSNFITEIVERDNRSNKWAGRVCTRFPPEPNGYLHIGHAKSICLNFGLAGQYGGGCNLRFDDTNPVKEEREYIDSIIRDVRWLGFRWPGAREDDPNAGVLYASDYFTQMYEWAVELINKGKAYVCDLSADQTREHRGTLTAPGRNSPYRDRPVGENIDLFTRMRDGEFPDGSKTLRAKIDMGSPNVNLRDPVMYRILHAEHPHAGTQWCVYPMYDWAHGLEDSIEGITHSICTLEFEDHRPLYDWYIDAINEGRTEDGGGPWGKRIHHPQQIEFARLNLTYTMMSKRKLLDLVKTGTVRGWDDPRMPTLSAMRRRGYTPEAIRGLCERVGVAKANTVVDFALLEHCVREDLNKRAARVMAVLNPLKVVIENYPEGQTDEFDAVNNPEDPSAGTRKVPFSRVVYIERDDFLENPPPKFFRLAPGREVRLRAACLITCKDVIKNPATGEIVELRCTWDPATRGGDAPDGRKVKGTIHWVSAAHAVPAEVRLYEHLFTKENPDDVPQGADYRANLNPNSLQVLKHCRIEPHAAGAKPGTVFQFERLGYFCVDPNSCGSGLVFNRTVSLKDAWAKIEKKA